MFWFHQIDSGLYRRQGGAVTNIDQVLPPAQSDLARQITKDPYNFNFLMLGPDGHERDLERGLLEHLREFLLGLGVGFAFVGSQHRLEVSGNEFYLDLLFYHLKLRAYVVVDLKNFYLSAVSKPIGISEYQLAAALPDTLKGTLPTIEELESELSERTGRNPRYSVDSSTFANRSLKSTRPTKSVSSARSAQYRIPVRSASCRVRL